MQVPQGAVVRRRAMHAGPYEPGGDGGVAMAKDARGCGHIQPFRKRREDFANAVGRGFEAIQRSIAARAEGGHAGLTAQRLSALAPPVGAVADQGVDLRVGTLLVHAGGRGTGEPVCVDAFGRTASAFNRRPGRHW